MKCLRPEFSDSERRVSDAQNASFAAHHSADTKMGGSRWGMMCFLFLAVHLFAADLLVYPPVPGIEASGHYTVRAPGRPSVAECSCVGDGVQGEW
jgi:heme/copper-type cytochrome/quinol oxidase subunit 3